MKRLLVCMLMICAVLWCVGDGVIEEVACFATSDVQTGIDGVEHFNAKSGIPSEYTPQEGSIEELYKDMIVTQLYPVVAKAIEDYYGKPLMYGLYDVRFMEVQREAYRGFSFLVKMRVQPFVGAHNTIGEDELIISIKPGQTKLEHFEHIRSYPVPDYRP